ncbi:MAG: SAP domain-containing protein [Nitrosarchaeum sp.]|nr:SAP domain-containing protein [Nitrosarchaeum sp.]
MNKLVSEYMSKEQVQDALRDIGEPVSGTKNELVRRLKNTWNSHNRDDYELLDFTDDTSLQMICYYYNLDTTPTNKSTYIRRIKKAELLDKNSRKPKNLKQERKLQKEENPFRDVNINIENIHLSKNSKIGIIIGVTSVVATIIGIIMSNGFS